MENQETPNPKYLEIKEHLKNVLKTAKRLGLQIRPGGGYAMGYDFNNLPPYPVGLFGALSIVEGQGARCKLGLTFEETDCLEAGFNGNAPKAKRKRAKVNKELMVIGFELRQYIYKEPKPRGYSTLAKNNFIDDDFQPEMAPKKKAQPVFAEMPAFVNQPADQLGAAAIKAKKKQDILDELAAGLKEKVANVPQEEQVKVIVAEALKNKDIAKQLVKLADAMNIPQPANLPAEWVDDPDEPWNFDDDPGNV